MVGAFCLGLAKFSNDRRDSGRPASRLAPAVMVAASGPVMESSPSPAAGRRHRDPIGATPDRPQAPPAPGALRDRRRGGGPPASQRLLGATRRGVRVPGRVRALGRPPAVALPEAGGA